MYKVTSASDTHSKNLHMCNLLTSCKEFQDNEVQQTVPGLSIGKYVGSVDWA